MKTIGRRFFLTLALAFALPAMASAKQSEPSEVMVVASIHGYHAQSATFTYDDLYRLVAAFRPDAVGVEIRQSDLAQPDEVLARSYPKEMIDLARQYGEKSFGFDWLGDDVPPAPLPANWWRENSRIFALQKAFGEDAEMSDERNPLKQRHTEMGQRQLQIVADATAAQLADGRYDEISEARYAVFDVMTLGTPYEALARFYRQRDAKIAENVLAYVRANRGQRIVIVTGADHHGPLVRALSQYPDEIKLKPVTP